MKKLFLLLVTGAIAITAGAQERQIMNFSPRQIAGDRGINATAAHKQLHRDNTGASKATAGGYRWYNYADYIDTLQGWNNLSTGTDFTALYAMPIWNDTNGTINYTSGLAHLTDVSIGSVLDPKASGFNDGAFYAPGTMVVTATNAYTVDSVEIRGLYEFNSAKTSVVDTLRLTFMIGNGGAPTATNIWGSVKFTSGHYGTLSILDMGYDSLTNTGIGADKSTADRLFTQDVLIDNTTSPPGWADTLSDGEFVKYVKLTNVLNANANELVGLTISFKSGDPATHGAGKLASPTPGDTVITTAGEGTNKYNIFRPWVDYFTNTNPVGSSTLVPAIYAPYSTSDNNMGYYKTLPNFSNGWDDEYVPTFAWGVTSASVLQFPYVWWKVTCASCATTVTDGYLGVNKVTNVNSINAYPNPAEDEVNIAFSLTKASDVAVSLTNMIGQVVATQKLNNTSNGKAVFNTNNIPDGVYIYTLEANGTRSTGRVAISH